ncbi:lysozyme inhibitor LprI family protein [Rhizobium rhizoryzae]|uniref:lysozyme inhibitor LprI family protein n=1 Tax=Rhizobium rhizoryzae TaxID=451876 RepID=UPI00289E7F63|nr:hypothetical protein [Rhizobium rhizoryzae]
MTHVKPTLLVAVLATLASNIMLPETSHAASFDCTKSELAADEKTICEDRALNDLDVKMATTFEILTGLMPMGNRDLVRDEQATWLKKRTTCGSDAACLRSAYEERLKQLNEAYKELIKPL